MRLDSDSRTSRVEHKKSPREQRVSCFERLEYSKTLRNILTLVFSPHHGGQGRSVTKGCSGVEQRQALGYDARERDWLSGGGTAPPSS